MLPAAVDVVVVGAGLVGASVAAALASHPSTQGLAVALVDPKLPDDAALPPVSLRTATVNPSSKAFLDRIGAWQHVPHERIASFDDMVVWDSASPSAVDAYAPHVPGAIRFQAGMLDAEVLGYVVDNDALRYALLKCVRRHDVALVPAAIDGVDYGDDAPTLRFGDGRTLATRLIVACDGARSRMRVHAGLRWHSKAYGEAAVVATVALAAPPPAAYQRFLSTGPVAVLPMPPHDGEHRANVVWSTTQLEARALADADPAIFTRELASALADSDEDAASPYAHSLWQRAATRMGVRPFDAPPLPRIEGVRGPRASFPLHVGLAPEYVDGRRRTVLAGDAAHNVHPLAGQGVNLGFADAEALASAVAADAAVGEDVGGPRSKLMRYQTERMPRNLAMLALLHGIHATFGARSGAVRDARRIATSLLNSAAPAKRAILNLMR